MLTPLALFVSLLLATAFIAHWSDNLGKKLGKKRVSVLGLRPRTSATVLTVASSWVIMVFTLAVLLGAVTPLRHALFHYDAERAQAKVVEAEREVAQRERDNAKQEAKTAQEASRAALADVQTFRTAADTARTDARKSQSDARRFQSAAKSAQSAFKTAQRNEEIARTAARDAQNQQRAAQSAFAGAQHALGQSKLQLARTQSDLARGRTELARAQGELVRARTNVSTTTAQLNRKQAQVKAADARVQVAQARVHQAQAQLGAATAATTRIAQLSLRLGPQVVAMQRQVDELRGIAVASSGEADVLTQFAVSDIRLPVDQTLAERRIDAGQSPEQIERELRILLNAASGAAGGIIPGATLSARAIVPDPQTKAPLQLDESQSIELYARLLSSANQSVSARIASAANFPANSSEVLARFVFVPIRTIYSARQSIAQAKIETDKSESAIFGQLQKLVDEARFNAVKRGASPPLSPEVKNFFDGDTGQKLFDALRQVQKVGRLVTVRVVAARDLDSAEPLQVRFVVGEQTA